MADLMAHFWALQIRPARGVVSVRGTSKVFSTVDDHFNVICSTTIVNAVGSFASKSDRPAVIALEDQLAAPRVHAVLNSYYIPSDLFLIERSVLDEALYQTVKIVWQFMCSDNQHLCFHGEALQDAPSRLLFSRVGRLAAQVKEQKCTD